MSEGQSTQATVNVLTWVSAAGGVVFLILMFVVMERELAWGLVVLLLLVSIPFYLMKCKSCGLHVTKEADGTRSGARWPPMVNPQCKKCGADIP